MKCIVFYENWQMECCGTAFSVGDTVKLTVTIKTAVNLSSQFYRYFFCPESTPPVCSAVMRPEQ